MPADSPTKDPKAYAYYVGADASNATLIRTCATDLTGLYGSVVIDDASGTAAIRGTCGAVR